MRVLKMVLMIVTMMIATSMVRADLMFVMWRNFSFPCMTIVGKLKMDKYEVWLVGLLSVGIGRGA